MPGTWVSDYHHTTRKDSLSDNRNAFQAILAQRRPTSPDFFVRPESVAGDHQFATTQAARGSLGCQTLLPCRDFSSCELLWKLIARAEVHFARSLCVKRSVRKMRIRQTDIEHDQGAHLRQHLERLPLQPLVFEHAPPSFDRRVRELNVSLHQPPFHHGRPHKIVHSGISVFATVVD
jgi:hypothetical protein